MYRVRNNGLVVVDISFSLWLKSEGCQRLSSVKLFCLLNLKFVNFVSIYTLLCRKYPILESSLSTEIDSSVLAGDGNGFPSSTCNQVETNFQKFL